MCTTLGVKKGSRASAYTDNRKQHTRGSLAETCERISFVTGFTTVAMHGTYDQLQVALSVLIAISASYAALDLAGRVTTATRARLAWLCGGAIAMGLGIWAMHFTGMLAFHLPVPVGYYWPTVLQSLLLTIWNYDLLVGDCCNISIALINRSTGLLRIVHHG
jgi:hypothetical protein